MVVHTNVQDIREGDLVVQSDGTFTVNYVSLVQIEDHIVYHVSIKVGDKQEFIRLKREDSLPIKRLS